MSDRPRDLYTRLDELDEPSLRALAGVLEIRGSHPRQVEMRVGHIEMLGELVGQRVLDVGCGTGVVTRDIARQVGPGGLVVGVDPTPVFVEIAERLRQEANLDGLHYQTGDGRALDFPDSSFDVVMAITVLSHLPARTQVLAELARVVRPGGRLLVTDGDYVANQLAHTDRATTDRIISAWVENVVDDPLMARRLPALIAASGFQVEAIRGHVHVEAGRVDEATSYIWQWALFALNQALAAGAVSAGEGAAWREELAGMNAEGTLYGSVNYVSVLARRPQP